jgi:hypothetical protein
MPSIIDDPELYEQAKRIVYQQYPKHSAYRSGQLVKQYKSMGGTYSGKKDTSGLVSWFKENWKDIGGLDYPVYRPTIRVNKKTPLTPDEIDPENLQQQILLKQKIKGKKNLPAFVKRGEGIEYEIKPYSFKQADKLGVKIKPSTNPKKKIDVFDYNNQYILSIGARGYGDFPTYLEEKGKTYADERRRLYKIRHNKDRMKEGSAGYYADQLLW